MEKERKTLLLLAVVNSPSLDLRPAAESLSLSSHVSPSNELCRSFVDRGIN